MSNRDEEIDVLLKPLRKSVPNFSQMQSWKQAVQGESRVKVFKVTKARMVMQMAAAMFVGFVIGAVLFREVGRERGNFEVVARNYQSSATFEHSHTNLD